MLNNVRDRISIYIYRSSVYKLQQHYRHRFTAMRFGDTNDGISRSKIHPFRIDLNLYRLSKIGWWGRGRRGGKKSAFPPAEIRFFNFYKIRLSHSNNTHLPMQFPGENRLSTAAKLDRQICCFTRFTHAPPPSPTVCARHVK